MITVNAFMGDAYSFPNLRKLLTFLVCKGILSHFSQTKNNSNSSFSLLPPNSPQSTYLVNLLPKILVSFKWYPHSTNLYLSSMSVSISFISPSNSISHSFSLPISHFSLFSENYSTLSQFLFFFFYYTYHLPPSKTHCRTRFAPTCRCTSASWGMRTISDPFGW